MSAPIQTCSTERIPAHGCLLIPGRLELPHLLELEKSLTTRTIIWLIDENANIPPDLQSYIETSGKPGASFSTSDPLEETSAALAEKTKDGSILIYVPGTAQARAGTPIRIPVDTLHFLCSLKLPLCPLDINIPSEISLAIENKATLPAAILTFGQSISAQEATIATYRQSILAAAQEAFSSRPFLKGSLPIALLEGLKKHANTTTIFDGTDDSELPFAKILGAAIALSKEIKKETQKKRVGIILPPGKGGLIANLAVLFANKIPVNLNFTASHDAVRSSIRQGDLDKFITADPFVRKVPSFPWPPNRDLIFIERLLPQIKKSIIKWVIIGKLLPTKILAKLLRLGKSKNNDEAVLLFTSGSSGEPKGVPLSHRNLLANVCQFGTPLALPQNSKILGCLPLFHSFGCTVTLWYPIIEGINLVTYPSPLETKRLAELIHQHNIYLLLATPTFLRGYMRRIEPEQLSPLKIVVTGAEKLPENLAHSFQEKFGLLPMEGYGLTETSPATNVNLPEDPPTEHTPTITTKRFGSVGPPLPGIAVKITNPTTDKPTTLDQSGIIWLKGPNIFQGYLNKQELTDEVIIDQWFKTGDVGRMDQDGLLYIEGRISRFSKIAGEMVPHETVEAAVNKALGLDQETERKIAIVGVPDDKKGEAIVLLSTIASQALEQECLDIRYKLMDGGIPSLWCPRNILPVDEIPILASGKLDIKGCEALAK